MGKENKEVLVEKVEEVKYVTDDLRQLRLRQKDGQYISDCLVDCYFVESSNLCKRGKTDVR